VSHPRDIAVIVGSLRKGSFNRTMAHALAALAPAGLRLEIVEIRDLPLYDPDLEAAPPASWLTFRERIKRADAVLFGANHHLRQSLVFLNMPAMQQPEAYIGGAANLFDANGAFTADATRELMQRFMQTFAGWVDANARA